MSTVVGNLFGILVMFIVKNVSKSLGNKEVLHNINFCLKKGQITALVGPNGAGKTTLMRCMIGFYDLSGGEIIFDNKRLLDDREKVLQDIAYVPEIGGLYPDMTVFEYLQFMASIKAMSKDIFAKSLKRIVDALELATVINQKCDTLSKGYKRRVAVAEAMINSPKVLILDEPTEGLDPQQKKHLRTFLQEYGKKNIVLISTHIMEEVEAMADRILMIKDGKLVCDTTPDELKKATLGSNIEHSFYTIIGK